MARNDAADEKEDPQDRTVVMPFAKHRRAGSGSVPAVHTRGEVVPMPWPTPSTPPPRKRRRGVFVLGAVVALALLLGAYLVLHRVPMSVAAVTRAPAVDAVYATGTLEAQPRVTLRAKVGGTVAEVLAAEGSVVKQGDLLVRLENPAVVNDLARGEADVSAADAFASSSSPQLAQLQAQAAGLRAQIVVAKADLDRTAALVKSGSVSAAELDRARAHAAELRAALAANAQAQRALKIDAQRNAAHQHADVKTLSARAADTEIRAPFDGVVLSKSIELGEVVTANQPLLRVGDTRHLIIEVAVDEADVARVRDGRPAVPGQPPPTTTPNGSASAWVRLYAYPNKRFMAHVTEVLPDANRERKSYVARLTFDDAPEGLRSGMSVEANIIVATRADALIVPATAVKDGFVWRVEDGKVRRRPVEVGIRDLARVELTSGVAKGDLVVIDPPADIQEGTRVKAVVRDLATIGSASTP